MVFPLEIVRSPRGLRLLRQPMDNATLEAKVLSLSTQLVCGTYRTGYRRLKLRYSTNCPHKPATGRFVCGMTISSTDSHFLFGQRNRNNERREQEWRFTIWKQRLSAGAQAALR